MTYTWFWTAHGSTGKQKYHYQPMFSLPVCLCLGTETAKLGLGKDPDVFSKRPLHIVKKSVKVRVFPVLATASIIPVVISQSYTHS